MAGKKGKGKQKIEIKRIQHEKHRQVTFSKRRNGLFNKATELSILCGAEVALMVFSPAGKIYSFAHPSVHSMINRYVDGVDSVVPNKDAVIPHGDDFVRELSRQLTQVTQELATEKKKAETLNGLKADQVLDCWWEKPIDEHDVAELKKLMVAMEEFKKNVNRRAHDLMSMEASSSSPSPSFSPVNPDPLDFVIPASTVSEVNTSCAAHDGFQMDFGLNDFQGLDDFDSCSWSSFEE